MTIFAKDLACAALGFKPYGVVARHTIRPVRDVGVDMLTPADAGKRHFGHGTGCHMYMEMKNAK